VGRVLTSVSLCVCLFSRTISTRPMQIGSPNLTQKWSKISRGNPCSSGQKVKDQGHDSQKHCWRGYLHSCECWLFTAVVIVVVVFVVAGQVTVTFAYWLLANTTTLSSTKKVNNISSLLYFINCLLTWDYIVISCTLLVFTLHHLCDKIIIIRPMSDLCILVFALYRIWHSQVVVLLYCC